MRVLLVSGKFGIDVIEGLRRTFPEIFPENVELDYLVITSGIVRFVPNRQVQEQVRRRLSKRKYEYVIAPYGLVLEIDSIPVIYLKHVGDVPALLHYLLSESSDIPRDVRELYIAMRPFLEKIESFVIDHSQRVRPARAYVGRRTRIMLNGLPTRIVAEIIDATRRDVEECLKIANIYVEEGADFVDVGCIAGEPRPENVRKIVKELANVLPSRVGISVDSLVPSEIQAGIEAGADLILSVMRGSFEKISDLDLRGIGLVVIPDNPYMSVDDMRKYFEEMCSIISRKDAVPIVDPLLSPPLMGFVESLCRYRSIRENLDQVPMLMGIGNVTELVDADSSGVNALLAVTCAELEIDLVLTTEASIKTLGSVGELKRAFHMVTAARLLSKYPKDMSTNVLVCKRKW
ncbi:MAG: dihydropteroate synthase [Crenarchaeota archaeon]|nr:dihydropteroate synthase [Thermoproteota archaeon]